MRNVVMIMLGVLLVSVTHADLLRSDLPDSTYYSGQHDRYYDLGGGQNLLVHLEFAVYNGSQAQDIQAWTGHAGSADFVYAYQVFCDSSNAAGLTMFSLTGINPASIADVQNDIGENEYLDDGIPTQSGGVAPTSSEFNESVTEAMWQFEAGELVQGDQSWFLFIYSNNDMVAGDFNVQQLADDDIPVPGDNEVPEPATLALLACGAILSLRRKKK